MSHIVLSDALRDGQDGYHVYSTRLELPDASFRDLSKVAQKIVRFGGSEPLTGAVSPIAMVPDSWDPGYRRLFFALPETERVELCGFLTVIIHECQHHFDLLRTPFGLSLHEKLARDFLAFERWLPPCSSIRRSSTDVSPTGFCRFPQERTCPPGLPEEAPWIEPCLICAGL